MSVTIETKPYADSLDMLGEPDRSSAYSLSGHVAISISSMASFFDRRRTVRLILRSLTITFEGQTELVAEETGYAAVRLCSISQELAPGEPVELSNEGHEDSDKPCTWNVVFNLTIPGWLPATTVFGDTDTAEAGTRYALYATAKFESIEDGSSSRSWFAALCTPFRHQTRVLRAPKYPIQLNRYVNPSSLASSSTSPFPMANFNVTPEVEPRDESESDHPQIPLDVLGKIRIFASVPENVSADDASLPLTLRFRPDGLSPAECERLRISEFSVDVEQCERYRTSTLPSYAQVFPLPPTQEQPPHQPLISAHPIQSIFELGLADIPPPNQVLTRSFSLLPDTPSGKFQIAGNGYIFSRDVDEDPESNWYSLQTCIPFIRGEEDNRYDWKNQRTLRVSGQSPLFGVQHSLHVNVLCTYDLTEGEDPERAQERLSFRLPLRFVNVFPVPSRTSSPSPTLIRLSLSSDGQSSSRPSTSSEYPVPSLPYAQTLPAYSQLFEPNGDRKIDYSFPLPLYTPHATADDLLCDISH